MPSRALRLAAVLVFAITQTAIVERVSAAGGAGGAGGGGWGGHAGARAGGHVIGGRPVHNGDTHFARPQFGNRFRRNPLFIGPYGWGWGWDWPYQDYGAAPSAAATSIVAYPPPLRSGYRADNCRWNEDTFSVPSSAGGKRSVEVVSCR